MWEFLANIRMNENWSLKAKIRRKIWINVFSSSSLTSTHAHTNTDTPWAIHAGFLLNFSWLYGRLSDETERENLRNNHMKVRRLHWWWNGTFFGWLKKFSQTKMLNFFFLSLSLSSSIYANLLTEAFRAVEWAGAVK